MKARATFLQQFEHFYILTFGPAGGSSLRRGGVRGHFMSARVSGAELGGSDRPSAKCADILVKGQTGQLFGNQLNMGNCQKCSWNCQHSRQ